MADRPITLLDLLTEAKATLRVSNIDDPGLEARLIVEHFSDTTHADAIARPNFELTADVVCRIRAALARRLAGEPVYRIFGYRDFFGMRLGLSAGTLEPRQDTETLVEAVLPFMRQCMTERGRCRLLDLGTGTGAIAIALLRSVDGAVGTATDISADALATAATNAKAQGLDGRLTLLQSDWFEKIKGRFDAIVSNPPYISTSEIAGLDREVREFDPVKALDGGPDGLDAYRAITDMAKNFLVPDGIVGVEIGYRQRIPVKRLFEDRGYRTRLELTDLGGNDRVLIFDPIGPIVQ